MGCKPITLEEARLREANANERVSSVEEELRQAERRVWEIQQDLKAAKQAKQRAQETLRRKLVEDESKRQQEKPTQQPKPRTIVPTCKQRWDQTTRSYRVCADSMEIESRHKRCLSYLGY